MEITQISALSKLVNLTAFNPRLSLILKINLIDNVNEILVLNQRKTILCGQSARYNWSNINVRRGWHHTNTVITMKCPLSFPLQLVSNNEHYSRCFSSTLRSPGAFGSRPVTIAAMNNCPVYPDQDVVINEVSFAEPEATPVAYVELYDGGRGNTALTFLTLVMFSARDNGAYKSVDLSGHSTNAEGYFLIGAGETGICWSIARFSE